MGCRGNLFFSGLPLPTPEATLAPEDGPVVMHIKASLSGLSQFFVLFCLLFCFAFNEYMKLEGKSWELEKEMGEK